MEHHMGINNIFKYATSELSQDAFLCWLFSHATEEGWNEDPQLRECALILLDMILDSRGLKRTPETRVTEIRKQYKNIDILLCVDDLRIIIEDKTFTSTHDDQINRYTKTLLNEGIKSEQILCVYYKIEEQPEPEKDVDFEFTRDMVLDLFRKIRPVIHNPIFTDYVEYLEYIDWQINSYKHLPICEWTYRSYIGLFKELCSGYLKDKSRSWGYVSNPTGGFMGLWWDEVITSAQLDAIGLTEDYCDELYLQIENNAIALKYTVNAKKVTDSAKVSSVRWKLFEYFRAQLGDGFKKKVFRPGNYMTVGYVEYNEKNYLEQLDRMHSALKALASEKGFISEGG